MINIKTNKLKKNNNLGNNSAVAAITQLYKDYHDQSMANYFIHFMVLKIHYKINSKSKKINIEKVSSYFLEEVNFEKEHKQDSRNWSKKLNKNSGRLIVSETFIKKNRVPENEISHKKTKKDIEQIYKKNKEIETNEEIEANEKIKKIKKEK